MKEVNDDHQDQDQDDHQGQDGDHQDQDDDQCIFSVSCEVKVTICIGSGC